jgi:hypothetical protein
MKVAYSVSLLYAIIFRLMLHSLYGIVYIDTNSYKTKVQSCCIIRDNSAAVESRSDIRYKTFYRFCALRIM